MTPTQTNAPFTGDPSKLPYLSIKFDPPQKKCISMIPVILTRCLASQETLVPRCFVPVQVECHIGCHTFVNRMILVWKTEEHIYIDVKPYDNEQELLLLLRSGRRSRSGSR